MNTDLNILAAWIGFLMGTLSGVASGLFFHDDMWLGGYDSWRRRLIRLGHIAFFELGFLNIAFVVAVRVLHWSHPPAFASPALAASVVLMSLVCFLSAWKRPLRHLFFLPVVCVLAGLMGVFIGRMP